MREKLLARNMILLFVLLLLFLLSCCSDLYNDF